MLEKLLNFFSLAFSAPPSPPSRQNVERDTEESDKSLISYFGRGNVALQRGNVMTAKDVSTLRKEVLSYKFR